MLFTATIPETAEYLASIAFDQHYIHKHYQS